MTRVIRLRKVALGVLVAQVLGVSLAANSVADGEAKKGELVAVPSAGAEAHADQAPLKKVVEVDRADACLTDPVAIEEMRKRREELDLREKELSKKEAEVIARAKAMEEELNRMEGIRDDMAKIDTSRKKENEERVGKLVETIQLMSPKAAAQLVGSLEEGLAVSTLSKMDTVKLAKVLNLMQPAKASRLSELLAGVVRAKGSARLSNPIEGRPEITEVPASAEKGGEKNGENNKNDSKSGNQSVSSENRPESTPRSG